MILSLFSSLEYAVVAKNPFRPYTTRSLSYQKNPRLDTASSQHGAVEATTTHGRRFHI